MTQLTQRLRRLTTILLRIALVLGVAVAALGVSVYVYLRLTSAQSDLTQSQWQRLRERFLEHAAVSEAVEPDPSMGSEPAPEIPAIPTRLPLNELDPETSELQQRQYRESRPKGILELQPFRRTTTLALEGHEGVVKNATLVNINATVNAWYLLSVEWNDGGTAHYHLVNAHPTRQDIVLDASHPSGVSLLDSSGMRYCELWPSEGASPLQTAASMTTPYVSLCDDQITLRLPVPGRRTTLEWATDFLRDNVYGGEKITVFVRQRFFQDAYLETAEVVADTGVRPGPQPADAPVAARMDPKLGEARIGTGDLGLELEDSRNGMVTAGDWHPVRDQPGVFVSVVRPDLLDPDVFTHHLDVVSRLDEVEREALVYLVAFDLARFDVGFAVGTEHPRVDWSERVKPSIRDDTLPGPDGIGDIDPLVRTGIVPRSLVERAVATFTGGFKRGHGAFNVSELAERNFGTHYGFIENGTVLSKLQPGLATLYVVEDGTVAMKTWTEDDRFLLPTIAFARQNGLPIIEPDAETGEPVPGRQVSRWAAGNWSGSQDRKFRTVRAGAALHQTETKRFLVYAYFSSATPSAMARVFEAFGARYAMLLDMNALEHTYLAMYRVRSGNLDVQHLVLGMEVLDKTAGEQTLPRFIGFADNRDFFYVVRKDDDDDSSP